ncbi:hypothetical protein WH50_10520 [Pokkaliibacter plantistimulans]|uniref:Copper chaperone PCu(A)C n=1 Tax=Pokkaliibacter plantistimulans TaxID=1635171 RepID=A0ABX5LYG8_9GAMM|nr:copper chaperone PCu(A)C [Pokkaliibacter plantistimulans]PXF31351.1 hypothetical protein WH50_10520 [Pokkaliibacter plantistimulans]
MKASTIISRLSGMALLLSLSSLAMADVTVTDGYARATPPGASNSAAFMTLHNSADQPVTVTSVSSSSAGVAELHNHTNNNGMMEMRHVEGITIPAKGEIQLKPGGYHVMLMQLKHPLQEGQQVELELTIEGQTQPVKVEVPVKMVMEGMNMGG